VSQPASAKANLLDQALLAQRLFLLFHREGSINGYPKVAEIPIHYGNPGLQREVPFARLW
jgi:hypothetical protein